jgi:hypothetical protein
MMLCEERNDVSDDFGSSDEPCEHYEYYAAALFCLVSTSEFEVQIRASIHNFRDWCCHIYIYIYSSCRSVIQR